MIELLDHTGTDMTIANSARVSFADFGNWNGCPEGYSEERAEKLIGYLAKHKHLTPFRHVYVTIRCKAPIFIARQLGKHQVGLCLHEDTQVTVIKQNKGASNGKKYYTMKELFKMWDGQIKYQGGKKGKMNVQDHRVRVYNEETQRFETSKILDVIDSGIKKMFEITDEAGNTIRASKDHKFLTMNGWKRLEELSVGDYLIRDDVGESFGATPPLKRGLDKAIRNHFKAQAEPVCERCGAADDLEVDHVISVAQDPSLAKDFGNLQILCKSCHAAKSANERVSKTTLLPKMIPIVSITEAGESQCYDLSMENIHNFMGNGFVVHNSWNEVSRRYVDSDFEFFYPKEWRGRPDGSIKQGSAGVVTDTRVQAGYKAVVDASFEQYELMLECGVAPEQARMILPQSMLTTWVWSGSLLAFAHVYNERSAQGAQLECQEFAHKLDEIITPLFPIAWKALTNKGN